METNNQQKNTIKEQILEKIKTQEVSMRPKSSFIWKVAIIALVASIIFSISVFICNFILFHIIESGRGTLLEFGLRGYLSFLRFFPWTLLFADIVLIVGLQYLLKTFEFGYKRPGVYLTAGLVIAVLASGLIVSLSTPLNKELQRQSQTGRLPRPVGNLYDQAQRPPEQKGICECRVLKVTGDIIVVQDIHNTLREPITIQLLPQLPHDFEINSIVFIAGDILDGQIRPFGIHKNFIRPGQRGSRPQPVNAQ